MKRIQATNTTCYKPTPIIIYTMATITNFCSTFDKSVMRPIRSVPKVNYAWMDVQPDNFMSDPDFTYEEDNDDEFEDDEYEPEPGQFSYAGMEFTEDDAPVTYDTVRWWDRKNLRVIWRTVQKSVLGDDEDDSDYYPSDEEDDE